MQRCVFLVLAVLVPLVGTVGMGPPHPNTFSGVHMACICNYNETTVNGTKPEEFGYCDYVWAAGDLITSLNNIPDPHNFVAHGLYAPGRRSRSGPVQFGKPYNLTWWLDNYPECVMYGLNSSGGLHPVLFTNRPWTFDLTPFLDYSNGVCQDQVWPDLLRGLQGGFSEISWDNTVVTNVQKLVGNYLPNGTFWMRYHNSDAAYTLDSVQGVLNMSMTLKKHMPGAFISVNQPVNAVPNWWAMAPAVDMVLDEAGITNGGHTPYYVTGFAWKEKLDTWDIWSRVLRKGLTIVNQLPYVVTTNMTVTNATARFDVMWCLATYLMVKQNMSYLWIGGQQQYGQAPVELFQPETSMANAIGYALGNYFLSPSMGVYVRMFSNGLAAVNPDASLSYSLSFTAGTYTDLYGNPVTNTTMSPHSGLVLLKTV